MKSNQKYIFEMPIKVRDYEVDAEGIVNNANYLHYMEHTRHEFCQQAGLSFREMTRRGLTPVVRHVDVTYLSSLGLGDSMISRLALERDGARFIFIQDIYDSTGTHPVARGRVTIVSVKDGRLDRGEILAEAFKEYLSTSHS